MIQAPRGMKDIFTSEAYLWAHIENILRDIFYRFNFSEIRTPMFENTELFTRSVGEDSDIAQKEMYTFMDKGGRSLTLKPEGTAPTVRCAIQNNLFESSPKLFYITPAFRYERPQSGRYREFHQCGAESFADSTPTCDAEIISLASQILNALGIKGAALKINSIGCENCRPKYNLTLKNFIADNLKNLCGDCQNRFELNPLRILDCKNDSCKKILNNAPSVLNSLCDECKLHFEILKNLLTDLNIFYEVDDKIVRGLDYYTRTVFEFIYDNSAICGGGRYDNLVSELGAKKIPAVGFGFGMERMINAIKAQNLFDNCQVKLDLFIGNIGENAVKKSFLIANTLRCAGFNIEYNNLNRSVKSQIKTACKFNAKFFTIIGDDEIKNGSVKIKNLLTKSETQIDINSINKFLEEN